MAMPKQSYTIKLDLSALGRQLLPLADLLLDAAAEIDAGVEGSFMGDEAAHPMAKRMRRVEKRCRAASLKLRQLSAKAHGHQQNIT